MSRFTHRISMRMLLASLLASAVVLPVDIVASPEPLPPACQTDCVTTYGEVLGEADGGVEAYSNCQADCVIFEPHRVDGTYTGISWQCVEFARRWLLVHKGAVYGDVDVAADIWTGIEHLTEVETGHKLPLASYLNGSTRAPAIGDLLVYARAYNDTGHVAVVTGVNHDKGIVEVGEQNFYNTTWQDDHAREIEMIARNGEYWLLDAYLLGWKHIIDRAH